MEAATANGLHGRSDPTHLQRRDRSHGIQGAMGLSEYTGAWTWCSDCRGRSCNTYKLLVFTIDPSSLTGFSHLPAWFTAFYVT
jgi:hypothetical protein